jgi:hypothetical protein
MTLFQAFCVLVFEAVVVGLLGSISGVVDEHGYQASGQKQANKNDMLTSDEEALLRGIVYDRGLTTTTPTKGVNAGRRIILLPDEMVELHKKKRIATLTLLIDIVIGARPQDALAAGGFAMALEGHPGYALYLCYHCPPDLVDEPPRNMEQTKRQRLIETVKEKLAQAKTKPKTDK